MCLGTMIISVSGVGVYQLGLMLPVPFTLMAPLFSANMEFCTQDP